MGSIQWKMNSPVGILYLVASNLGLQGVHWSRQPAPLTENLDGNGRPFHILRETVRQLDEYFGGQRQSFDLPLAPSGTEFQKKVWKALSQIPFGQTFSYTEIALKISNAKAVRAVGSANGKNPLSIIIPCHRVIAADGSLRGYAGGLDKKGRLLQLESGRIGSDAS